MAHVITYLCLCAILCALLDDSHSRCIHLHLRRFYHHEIILLDNECAL